MHVAGALRHGDFCQWPLLVKRGSVTMQGAVLALRRLAADAFSHPERCQQLHTPFIGSPDCVQGASVGAGRLCRRCPAAWRLGGARWQVPLGGRP